MQVDITGKNLEITGAMREHIETRFDKLEKWQVPLINPHVVINEEPNKQFKVDASVGIPGGDLVASSTHVDLYAAVTELVHKLGRQVNKSQHKAEARRATHANIDEIVEEPTEE